MKGAGMLVGNYELKETTLGEAQFFLSLKAVFLNFDYMNRVNKTNWKYIFFLMIRRPPRSTLSSSSAASDVYKRQP